ncbi:MAG: siphovirus ReqiPepy6 Gp37-like family protein [Bryobacterales bacterium]|nr:siphovirus ReqiPepy6 Gp37-like family protein [Bryobacterales bacterium]
MRIWADVYASDGTTRLGDGPIYSIKSASFTKALDGPGTFTLTLPGADTRALTLLACKRRIKVYTDDNSDLFRLLGDGTIETIAGKVSSTGLEITVSGADTLSLLRQTNTLMNRKYSAASVSTIATSLTALAGWTVSASGGNTTTIRYDGETVLKALQMLCEEQGLHFRLTSTPMQVEIGAFGANSGYRATNVERIHDDLYDNEAITLIETLNLVTDSKDICNWILPLGAGEGVAALTLQYSTRTTPYTIQVATGPDGRNYYYLTDGTSAGLYGTIQKVVPFKDISPASNTQADYIAAANQLYDAAAAYLARWKDKLDTYSMTLRNVRPIDPGEKIHVRFKGVVYRDGSPYTYRDINQDMWVMNVQEYVSEGGISQTLQVATVDRYALDAAEAVVRSMEAADSRARRLNPTPSVSQFTKLSDISSSFPVTVTIPITDATLDLTRVSITFITSNREGSGTTPDTISCIVDGIDRTGPLGGYWAIGGGTVTVDLDPALMTGYFKNAVGGLQQDHTVQFLCSSGSGRIEVLVELATVVQGVALV